MKVDRFEDLIAWQKGMDLVVEIYAATKKRAFSRDFALSDQIHRAAISVPANIAEGFDRATRAEFHRFLSIAKASCAELITHLHLARRLDYLDIQTFTALHAKAAEVSRIVGGLRAKIGAQRVPVKK